MLVSDAAVRDSLSVLRSNATRTYVSVDPAAITHLAQKLKAAGKIIPHWDTPYLHPTDDMAFATHAIPACMLDFNFWMLHAPDEVFTVNNMYEEPPHFPGSFAKDYCFWRAFLGGPVTASGLCMHFDSLHATEHFFRGVNRIPFVEERMLMMQEYGSVLEHRFRGGALHIYEEAEWDAAHLVELLVAAFPYGFGRDTTLLSVPRSDWECAHLGGHFFTGDRGGPALTFSFHKRAKLAALAYQGRALKRGSRLKPLSRMREIVAVPDFHVARFLHAEGVLVYAPELLGAITARKFLWPGSQSEVEIRASITEANFALLRELNGEDVSSPSDLWDIVPLDAAEWFGGKNVSFPHHLTPGTNY
ncbi:MAG: hypothetical protein A3B29_05335 [Candidatus Sungbacteria bacterium RIFCSPLOWO2_01_FULL_51_34]|nr:MAG: hypothetical protein A3B29_05335 [Candidatus Sungbacteria bacterium RIFCSPLOWO2_01_FULL_51_34]